MAVIIAAALLLLCIHPLAYAQQQSAQTPTWGNFSPFLALDEKTESYSIAPYMYVTRDAERKFSYKDIYERHISGERGTPVQGSILSLGAAPAPSWIVFSIENKSWNEDWVISFGQHMDGRIGLVRQIFLYDHFGRIRYIDNVTMQKNSFVAQAREIKPYVPIKIERGKKAVFVLFAEPAPGMAATLAPQIMTVRAHDAATRGPLNKSALMGFFLLGMAGVFIGAFIFRRNPSSLLVAGYYILQVVYFYYQNNTLYTDYLFSTQIGGILIATTTIAGLLATKSLLHVGKLQRAQGRSVSAFVIGLFLTAVTASFVIPDESVARPVLIYGSVLASYCFLVILSLAQSYRHEAGGYSFTIGWGLVAAGMFISILCAGGILPAAGFMVAAYWYSLLPQGILLAVAASRIMISGEEEARYRFEEETEERERLEKFKTSKESTEIVRLRKLIDHERQVMNELREREVQQNEEMRKAKEFADEANRAKSAFLAVISHEIRTPMTGIMGMVRLLQETTLSSDQRDYAQTIQDSGDAMVSLLNDILDFEKIESGKMDLEHVDFDLHRLINGVVTLMSGHAAAKNVALKLETGTGLPRFVIGDPVRLRQVLLNLTGNSIKFTSHGSVTIQVRVEGDQRDDQPVRKLYFGVRDTGIGISKAAQKNLFNPFAQADNSIARKFGGTGLGLAISQKLIEAMGGRILIDSTEGHGSTFYFILMMETGTAENAARQVGGGGAKMQKSEKSLRILIVEDNEINQRLLKEFVDRMGHEVTLAGSGEDALKIMAGKDFDMVLMDVELPGMSGMGTTKAIRALANRAKAAVPVIALSGNVRDEDIRSCYAANMNGHLSKPVDPKRLKQMIDKVIRGALDNPVLVEEAEAETNSYVQINRIDAPESSSDKTAVNQLPAGLSEDPEDTDSFQEAIDMAEDEMAAPSAPRDGSIFDPVQLQSLRDGMNADVFGEIISSLISKMDEIVEAMESFPAVADIRTVAARAHDLKGMAGNYGLKELSALAAHIEKAAKDDRGEDVLDMLPLLPQTKDRAQTAIENWAGQ